MGDDIEYWEEMIRRFDNGEPIPEHARFWITYRVRNVPGKVYNGNSTRYLGIREENEDDLKS